MAKTGPKRRPISERFWNKVAIKSPDECWPWTGAMQVNGYGVIGSGGKYGPPQRAHRVAYEISKGSIPEGMTIDHLCKNRACMNPNHLESVSIRENLLRGDGASGRNARKITCHKGHPFARVNSRGWRVCRTCDNERAKKYRAKKKATSG